MNNFVENCVPASINDKINALSAKFKINKALIVTSASLLPIVLVILLGFGSFIIDLIGFVYPLYCSIRAIESDDKDDDVQWLTYWLIFGAFKLFEAITDFLISFIPFYFIIKVLFLIWCYYPSTLGAKKIYTVFFKPYIVPYIPLDSFNITAPKEELPSSSFTSMPFESEEQVSKKAN